MLIPGLGFGGLGGNVQTGRIGLVGSVPLIQGGKVNFAIDIGGLECIVFGI